MIRLRDMLVSSSILWSPMSFVPELRNRPPSGLARPVHSILDLIYATQSVLLHLLCSAKLVPSPFRAQQIFELFFCKKIPLSRRVGYVMGGSVSGSVISEWISEWISERCMLHQSDWMYY